MSVRRQTTLGIIKSGRKPPSSKAVLSSPQLPQRKPRNSREKREKHEWEASWLYVFQALKMFVLLDPEFSF